MDTQFPSAYERVPSEYERARGGSRGEPLEPAVRSRFERSLGGDLTEVRVHTGAHADRLAAATGADAVTVGADVFLRAGAYDPATENGLRLLGHELAHTLQQARWRRSGPPMSAAMLAALETEADQAAERAVRGLAAAPGTERASARALRPGEPVLPQRHASWEHRLLGDASTADLVAIALRSPNRHRILTGILDFLGMWKDDPDSVTAKMINHRYPSIRTLVLRRSRLLVTYGELNTLPDYLADPTALDEQPREIMLPILQAVRQEGYNWVNWLLGGRIPVQFNHAVAIATNASFIDLLLETRNLDKLTADLGPAHTDHYTALVARNACHFAPFTWYRWEQFHLIARDLATRAHAATVSGERDRLTAMAWMNHGYADHFLQDSFAAGHLVNKNLVMQWFVEWAADRWYVPVANWDRVKHITTAAQPGLAAFGLYDPSDPGPVRDPQTAEEQVTLTARMATAGVRGDRHTSQFEAYKDYLAFLDSTVVQAASGVLHDHFNAESLWVASPDQPRPYQIWGDDTMLNGGDGVGIASETAHMSQQALLDILASGHTSISVQSIRDRFPASVRTSSGSVVSLRAWNEKLKSVAFGLFPSVHYYLLRAYPSIGDVSVDTSGGWIWQTLPGRATSISAGADGSIWILGPGQAKGGHPVHTWNGTGWTQVPGAGVRIAAGPNGPWLVNDAGHIFQRASQGHWNTVPGSASDISVGADGSVWILGTERMAGGHPVLTWNGTDWTQVPGAGVRIAAGPNGPWLINDAGHIFQRTSQGHWAKRPGDGRAISVGQTGDAPVWMLGVHETAGGHRVYTWEGADWGEVAGAGVEIAVDDRGGPWLVNDDGHIFRRVAANRRAATAPAAIRAPAAAELPTHT